MFAYSTGLKHVDPTVLLTHRHSFTACSETTATG